MSKLEALGVEFAGALGACTSEQDIRALQARYLGKKGSVSQLMKQMGALPPDQRRELGAVFNQVKESIEGEVARRLGQLGNAAAAADLARSIDVTLPGRAAPAGRLHLLTQIREQAVATFAEIGFEVAEGPQVDTDFHCFEALAIPKDHPARDMQDTFYLGDEVVLRPHTSPVQIRVMQSREPPVRIVAPGVVYRRDDDATHSPMFTQIEGLLVDEHVRFSDLKGVFLHFVHRTFGPGLDVRFRPSYFPFVEPGAEVDMQCAFCAGPGSTCRVCKGTGWVEIAGSGMVDPEVFRQVGYDSERYTGFAFGMGLERVAMLRHGVNDIKFFYEGDLRFLAQF
ncbi:MAG TPA: phenylalanine--tRNA ligase subunit alpha [Candidatus Acidoferrum sp.]|nr:phenylalanine--tRNA ligase subunit alpha [Candidatus Acidoferrum sp.]